VERDLGREAWRPGGDPQPLAALGPAVTEVGILVDVGLIQVDQQVPVAARTGEHVLELLDERLPPHRVGPAEQLLGLLPAQVETVESRPDRLAAAGRAELFAHPAGQALEGPAVRRVGAGYGRGDGGALGGADGFAKASPDAGTKGGRPPVRR
jgi:hypothetical protein